MLPQPVLFVQSPHGNANIILQVRCRSLSYAGMFLTWRSRNPQEPRQHEPRKNQLQKIQSVLGCLVFFVLGSCLVLGILVLETSPQATEKFRGKKLKNTWTGGYWSFTWLNCDDAYQFFLRLIGEATFDHASLGHGSSAFGRLARVAG